MSESFESPTTVSSEDALQSAASLETSSPATSCAHCERKLSSSLVARGLAEFAGTFFAVFVMLGAASWTLIGSGGTVYSTALAAVVAYGAAATIFGHISGGHFNPAVSLAAALTGKIAWLDALVYAVAQVLAGIAAAAIMLVLVPLLPTSTSLTAKSWWGFMINGFGENSPIYLNSQVNIDMKFAIIVELIGALIVISAVVGAMRKNGAPSKNFALTSALAYGAATFVTVSVTGASLNPARSTGVAIFAQNQGLTSSLPQLWVFWVVPLLAGAIVGLVMVVSSSLKKDPEELPVYTTESLDAAYGEDDLDEFNAVVETEEADSEASDISEAVSETPEESEKNTSEE